MKKILITGGQGFIGKAIAFTAHSQGNTIRISSRQNNIKNASFQCIQTTDINSNTNWKIALEDIDVVIHCAARAHVLNENAKDPCKSFNEANYHGTLNLAAQAIKAGVKRFIFLSSIGVNGAETHGHPYTADDIPNPHSDYSRSKHEAEIGLMKLASESTLEVVIIRPPLVYGPSAPGNFQLLLTFLLRGIPLPLGNIHNKRSLVALDNLVNLIITCLDHPAAANQVFLVSDGDDLSTSDLLRRMGNALGKPARLLPIPASWLNLAATLVGKRSVAQRLCGSLQVDIEKTRRLLGWTPPLSVDQGLKRAAEGLSK